MDLRKKLSRAPPAEPIVEVKLEQMGVPTVPLKRKKPIAAIQEPYANGVYREPPPGTDRRVQSMEEVLRDERKIDYGAPPRPVETTRRPKAKINYYWVAQLVLTALGVAMLALIYIKK
jgi:hypothetical protein